MATDPVAGKEVERLWWLPEVTPRPVTTTSSGPCPPHLLLRVSLAQGDQYTGLVLPNQLPDLLWSRRAHQHHVVTARRSTLQSTAYA